VGRSEDQINPAARSPVSDCLLLTDPGHFRLNFYLFNAFGWIFDLKDQISAFFQVIEQIDFTCEYREIRILPVMKIIVFASLHPFKQLSF